MTRPPLHLIAAHHQTPNESRPEGRSPREGVNAMNLFSRDPERKRALRSERKRAWDELSEIDRAVLLESVRQRREAVEQRRAVLSGLQSLRHDR